MKIRFGFWWLVVVMAFSGCVTVERFHEGMYQSYYGKYPWLRPRVYQICVREAGAHDLPVNLVLAVIDAESSGRTNAVSKAGALGLMQVMPKYWYKHGPASDLHKPEIGIKVGCSVLRWARDLAKGDVVLTLRNYERGPRGRGINWTYTNKILRNMEAI